MVEEMPKANEKFPLYKEHVDITERSQKKADKFMKKNLVTVISGQDVPKPIQLFTEATFCKRIQRRLEAEDTFVAPTAIQSQAWPVAQQGRDMIGIAQTGSGKTLAFILPAITHCMAHLKQHK